MSNSTTSDPWTMYQRVKEVGRGAHGFAFLCKRRKDNASVVIKELFGGHSSKEAQAKSMSEIQFLSIVRHPNIIAYFDCFTAEANQDNNSNSRRNTTLYIVMEYADGGKYSI